MEIVTGLSLDFIFTHNNNWWRFFIKHRKTLRLSILTNVIKMLACQSEMLGFQQFRGSMSKTSKIFNFNPVQPYFRYSVINYFRNSLIIYNFIFTIKISEVLDMEPQSVNDMFIQGILCYNNTYVVWRRCKILQLI